MAFNSVNRAKHSHVRNANGATSTSPTATVLSNASNTRIKKSTFNNFTSTNKITVTRPDKFKVLEILHKKVAPYAITNAGERADEAKCHLETRKRVVDRIARWGVDASEDLTAPVLWLSGPAGSGKTAIVATIAEQLKLERVPYAIFFFFRQDNSRNHLSPLIATLLHQILLLYTSLRKTIATILSTNPLIFDSTLEEQLVQLIVTPLRTIKQSSDLYQPLVLLIDGLDECDSETRHSQCQILRVFHEVLVQHPCLCRLLVSSRDESQIRTAFNQLSAPVPQIYLDEEYFPESDIRLFVTETFERVKKTHPLGHKLDALWPSHADIEGIVKKSSGQFIYAATVMRFIQDSTASPKLSLEKVQGIARIVKKSPFFHLDAVYTYILSQVDDQETLKDLLHAHFLKQESEHHITEFVYSKRSVSLHRVLSIYSPRYTDDIFHSCIADLTPIARYEFAERLLFYHASFPDYLLDQSRSGEYFVDIDAFNLKVLPALWKCVGKEEGVECIAYSGLCTTKKLTPDLINALMALHPFYFRTVGQECDIFNVIHNKCADDDDLVNYQRIIRKWVNAYTSRDAFDILKDKDLGRIPCGQRYALLAWIEHLRGNIMPTPSIASALHPTSGINAREMELWIINLLTCIHQNHYPRHLQKYKKLMKAWIFFAISNDIAVGDLSNFPNAQWYFRQGTMKKWFSSRLKIGDRENT